MVDLRIPEIQVKVPKELMATREMIGNRRVVWVDMGQRLGRVAGKELGAKTPHQKSFALLGPPREEYILEESI